MKKIISLVLAALMLTILSVPAFAADAPSVGATAPETEPSSPSTGDHSLVIILLAAFMSVVGAAFAFIARREN